jgi:signal transduction histidine kinase
MLQHLHRQIRQTTLGGLIWFAAIAPAWPASVLTNAVQVRRLSPEQAGQRLPVHLHGIALSDAAGGNGLVLQDQTEAIYLIGTYAALADVHRGELITVQGVTDPGDFAPIVRIQSLKKTGTGPLPAPRPVTFEDLMRKHFDAQDVEIRGIVRSCEPTTNTANPRTKMFIATGGGQLAVRLHSRLPADSYVDAEVRVRGICFSQHTAGRQFISPMLDVPNGVKIEIEQPAPLNPFQTGPLPVADLLKFATGHDYGHRVFVSGVVTHYQPGNSVWIRDGSHGLRVQSRQQADLRAGDLVDVLGFPNQGSYSPILEDGYFIRRGRTNPPPPILVTNLAAATRQDADLVQIEARLVAKRPVLDGWVLTLDWNNSTIEAWSTLPPESTVPDAWQPNSRVRLAGICSVIPDSGGALSGIQKPRAFSLLMRSPEDLTVVQTPSWWTREHIMLLLGAVAALSLIVTVLVMWLARTRLREQATHRAMAEAEFAAILSERNRMAREIHDTLAQGLVATSVQLQLAKKHIADPATPLGRHLDTAQQLVRGSLEEARGSIWNMRSQILESSDLAGALGNILKQLAEGSGTETRLDLIGTPRRFAPLIENNLLRVGQEAITNAIKHAQARTITVTLEFTADRFRLSVRDDGRGFDPAKAPHSEGGFGLVGLRERATHLNGELTVRSDPAAGTDISLTVPLAAE